MEKFLRKINLKKNHIVIKNGKIFKLTKNIKSFKSKKLSMQTKKLLFLE